MSYSIAGSRAIDDGKIVMLVSGPRPSCLSKFPNIPTDTTMESQFNRIGGCSSNVQVTASGEKSASDPGIAPDFSPLVLRATNLEENIDIFVWFLIPFARIVCELNSQIRVGWYEPA